MSEDNGMVLWRIEDKYYTQIKFLVLLSYCLIDLDVREILRSDFSPWWCGACRENRIDSYHISVRAWTADTKWSNSPWVEHSCHRNFGALPGTFWVRECFSGLSEPRC